MGGFGPLAGAHFYRRLIELTAADGDAAHLPVILVSDPQVPDRLRHLRGEGPSPVAHLQAMARSLQEDGCGLIAIPSATVHAYLEEIAAAVSIPLLSLPRAALGAALTRGSRRVALLATTPTVQLGLYAQPAAEGGARLQLPDAESQGELMQVIAGVKSGLGARAASQALRAIADRPWAEGADALLLGCTELPAVFARSLRPPGTIDATDELARAAIAAAGGRSIPDAPPQGRDN